MDTRILFILLAGGLVLTSGCVSEKRMYVCFDGSVVSDSRECPREEAEKIIVTRYVCPDGAIVDNAGDCLTTTTAAELGTTTSTVTESTTTTTKEETAEDCRFVASINSDKYHYPNCSYAERIKPENMICFTDEKDAQEQGYNPCELCKPPT